MSSYPPLSHAPAQSRASVNTQAAMQAQGPGRSWPARVSEEMKGREVMTEAELRRQERITMASELSLGVRKDKDIPEKKNFVQENKMVERGRDDPEVKGKRKGMVEAMATAAAVGERKFIMKMRMNDELATTAAPQAAWISNAMRIVGVVENHHDKRPKTVAEESSIVGEWEIVIPDDEHGNGDDEDYYMSVHRSHSGHLDAAFHMPPIKGTIRLNKKKPTTKDRTLKFKWRGRKTTGEREVQVGEGGVDYTGVISLTGMDQLEGFYEGPCGTIKFEGVKVSGTPRHTGMAWDSFTRETQLEEQAMRWGGTGSTC